MLDRSDLVLSQALTISVRAEEEERGGEATEMEGQDGQGEMGRRRGGGWKGGDRYQSASQDP